MDFENAKENIQPLAAGRNASILHASLRVESPQELLTQRRELEQAIHGYNGDDPLEPWYSYISWIEQSFPSGGKESGLEEVLTKCLSRFENEERYFQDRRMIKLYMKFIDSHQQPMECYQQLFNAGIGTMVADFYICWAYHYDLCGNSRKADEIFRRGIACRAQPLDELQEAHQHFGFSIAQRLMYQDDEDVKENTKRQFEERRLALTSLRGHRRKATVGSIRTGSAVKSLAPGTVQAGTSSLKQSNARVQVFQDENAGPNIPFAIDAASESAQPEEVKSVVRSIIDAARNQENLKEPGPWNKAHDKKKSGKLFGRNAKNSDLGFSIHEDVEMEDEENDAFKKPLQSPITDGEDNYNKPFKYPTNFKSKNLPQSIWITPVTIENESDPRTLPQYNKCFMYPRPNVEFQPEEYRAFCWFKKCGITNKFTEKRNTYWCCNDVNGNVRQYPNFAKQSKPQKLDELDTYYEPEKKEGLVVCFSELYDSSEKVEYQWEELMAKRLRRNDTILMTADMDETVCGVNERAQRRKSFFPLRKSIAPRPSIIPAETKRDQMNDQNEDPKQSIETNPKIQTDSTSKIACTSVPTTKSALPFEIFEDTSQSIITTRAKNAIVNEVVAQQNDMAADFQFKTPALPATTSSTVGFAKAALTNKLGFEIYTESSISGCVTTSPPTTEGAVENVFFDPEETCSTQTFNIFIKSQSVSTPKIPQKVAPRQFGSILKVVPNPPEISTSPILPPTVETNVDEMENALKPTVEYSPLPMKQLSTILETSEHGTTQGTCTTGGTITKSSNSTSDGEGEREIATRILKPHTELEPLEEQSRESSTIPNEECSNIRSNITTQAKNTHNTAAHELSTTTPQIIVTENATPAHMRLQLGVDSKALPSLPTTGLNFSIFEDEQTEQLKIKQAGNFTRIDDREDTAAGYAIRSVRFQEDKTETMNKMLSIVKFQEDKTETIPKLPLTTTAAMTPFDMEQTGTIPKITSEPPALPAVKNMSSNLDDSFEFFGQSPPGKSILHPRYEVSAFKECMDARTPLMLSAKRHCHVNTPDLMHLKAPRSIQKQITTTSTKTTEPNIKGTVIFEDEIDEMPARVTKHVPTTSPKKLFNSQKVIGPSVPTMHRVVTRESILPDFSFIEETQPKPSTIIGKTSALVVKNNEISKEILSKSITSSGVSKEMNTANKPQNAANEQQAKADLSDSYLKDFSEIMDTQAAQSDNKWHRTASISRPTEKLANENVNNSFLKDFSAVMESRSTENEKSWLQNKSVTKTSATKSIQKAEPSKLAAVESNNDEHRLKFDLGNSYLKDFSMTMNTQSLQNQNEQQPDRSTVNKLQNCVEKGEEKKKNVEMRNSFLNDFSLIMESQPVVSERQLGQNKSITKKSILANKYSVTAPKCIETGLESSYLKDFSLLIPETQPIEDAKDLQQNKLSPNKPKTVAVHQNMHPTAKTQLQTNESYLKEFSRALEEHALEKSPIERVQEQCQKLTIEPVPTTTSAATALPSSQPLMFLNSYMKDFSGFQGPPADPIITPKKTTRLTFLTTPNNILPTELKPTNPPIQSSGKLHFLDSSRSSLAHPPLTNRLSNDKYFELNAETAMFSTNISMIKNSTLLPQIKEPNIFQAPTPIKEQSIHIKVEPAEEDSCMSLNISKKQPQDVFKTPPPVTNRLLPNAPNAPHMVSQPRKSVASTGAVPKQRDSKIPQPLNHIKSQHKDPKIVHVEEASANKNSAEDDEDDAEMSIYFKHTPKTPKIQQHIWNESSPSPKSPSQNVYVHREVDLNVTNQIIDNVNVDPHVNPFNGYLQSAFLEQIDFGNYISELPNCMMVGHVSRISSNVKVKVNNVEFNVLKLIGEGAYGAVFCGTDKTGKKYALKQERPPNFWEYYICLEVHSRLNSDDLVSAFMGIDYALIGNNASILISPFSMYGSLISVCNKVKKHTLRNVDEYVVMLLACELLSIIDHLHAVNIIHADIKADNFLLMNKLDYNSPSNQYAVQLIDFGVSIDMKLFKSGQTFNYVHNENAFKCVEMREGRPWTYQLDLYGLAGVIHVLLFGKFMDIEQRPNGIWMHKTHVPRYINRTLWDTIFQALLNVRDCETMPNLQNLRALIKEEIAEKEKFVVRKVAEFNSALSA